MKTGHFCSARCLSLQSLKRTLHWAVDERVWETFPRSNPCLNFKVESSVVSECKLHGEITRKYPYTTSLMRNNVSAETCRGRKVGSFWGFLYSLTERMLNIITTKIFCTTIERGDRETTNTTKKHKNTMSYVQFLKRSMNKNAVFPLWMWGLFDEMKICRPGRTAITTGIFLLRCQLWNLVLNFFSTW